MKALIGILLPALLWAEAGVLIPGDRQEPDAAVLSLREMEVRVRIDGQHATVQTRQIFANHTGNVLEGTYRFTMPGGAAVSDFAIWDDVTRIPGVILERRRAEEIYNIAKMQAIDPGLLQQGEDEGQSPRPSSVFTARVVPIPAWGTKRLELEYQQRLTVENFESFFAIPLRPDAYRAVTAGKLSITFELTSSHALRDFELLSKAYPLQIRERTPNRIRADYEASDVSLGEDFAVRYTLDPAKQDTLQVRAHRDETTEPGFFEASALLGAGQQGAAGGPPRIVVALFDNSLSMQWEKLERSFLALEKLLRGLRPVDRFNVLLFNSEVSALSPGPVAASPQAVEGALDFVRKSRLRGGTNLQAGLSAALAQSAAETYLVLITDGSPTSGPDVRGSKIAGWYADRMKQLGAKRPRTFVFAVGDDANAPLLRQLAQDEGVFEWVRSTEPPEFKLNAFLSKIGRRSVEQISLRVQPASQVDLVYPLHDAVFGGSMAAWVGQYKQPGTATFEVTGVRDGTPVNLRTTANLPAQSADHPELPRTWARARVDALLAKIDSDGEDRATIDEIIRLSRKYKFVTPYTSFLAAPRALLRPRLIRPGDPVLRVHTDPSIVSVVALFPFGLVKPLRFLRDEDVWQTRFLAPADMPDGTHQVRLLLRDKQGRVFREAKTFLIASKPPEVRVKLDKARYRRGETVRLKVGASQTSRTITARMYGVTAVNVRWNERQGSNTGEFVIPSHLPAGSYPLRVTAEDFAHNIGSQEVPIEILP